MVSVLVPCLGEGGGFTSELIDGHSGRRNMQCTRHMTRAYIL